MVGFFVLLLVGYVLYRWLATSMGLGKSVAKRGGLARRRRRRRSAMARPSLQPPGRPRPPSTPPLRSKPPKGDLDLRRLVRNVAYLRRALGPKWPSVVEPFALDTSDPSQVDKAVRRLSRHVGLGQQKFEVKIADLGPSTGGLIRLKSGDGVVPIELATDTARHHPSLLAVLAHEITHKALFDEGVHKADESTHAYEVLTDVAAIYFGFGKLMLNGYEYRASRSADGGAAIDRVRVRFGYISVKQVAFVHAFVSHMRRMRPRDWYGGLSPFARRELEEVLEDPAVRYHITRAPRLVPADTYARPGAGPRRGKSGRARHNGTTLGGVTAPSALRLILDELRRLRDRLVAPHVGDD